MSALLAGLGSLLDEVAAPAVTGVDFTADLETGRRARAAACPLLAAQAVVMCRVVEALVVSAYPEERGKLRIGFIGCGVLGKHILNRLLANGIHPENISVSTRRPKTLSRYTALGVDVCFDNPRVARISRVLMLCVLPSQLGRVAESLAKLIRRRCVILSFLLGITTERLSVVFKCNVLAIRPRVIQECLPFEAAGAVFKMLSAEGAVPPDAELDPSHPASMFDISSPQPEPAAYAITPNEFALAAYHLCPDVAALSILYSRLESLVLRLGLNKEASDILVGSLLWGASGESGVLTSENSAASSASVPHVFASSHRRRSSTLDAELLADAPRPATASLRAVGAMMETMLGGSGTGLLGAAPGAGEALPPAPDAVEVLREDLVAFWTAFGRA